jgi:hypothetical protein
MESGFKGIGQDGLGFIPRTKKEFLIDCTNEVRNALQPIDDAIIDEAIDSIIEGKSTINGAQVTTREERFMVISYHIIYAKAALKGLIEGAMKTYPDATINVNYRDKKYSVTHKKS